MKQRTPTSFLFRVWTKAHGHPLRLSALRPMWHELRRVMREHARER